MDALAGLIIGIWWAVAPSRSMRERLASQAGPSSVAIPDIIVKAQESKLSSARAL